MIQVQLGADQVEAIAERLKDTPLKLPRSLGDDPAAATKQEYLASLLSRDTGVFLERHGEALNTSERALFEPLRTGSFEVDFYMRQLEQTDANQHSSSSADRATVRNRRLAKLNRIEADEFFSEAAIRKRAPELANQYIGLSSPAETVASAVSQSDPLDRLEQQVMLQEEQNEAVRQQQALQEQRPEEEEEENEEGGDDMKGAGPPAKAHVPLSEEDVIAGQENQEVLISIMRARFLSGNEPSVDYQEVDNDASLDDDWAAQADQDAQDRYFEGD